MAQEEHVWQQLGGCQGTDGYHTGGRPFVNDSIPIRHAQTISGYTAPHDADQHFNHLTQGIDLK